MKKRIKTRAQMRKQMSGSRFLFFCVSYGHHTIVCLRDRFQVLRDTRQTYNGRFSSLILHVTAGYNCLSLPFPCLSRPTLRDRFMSCNSKTNSRHETVCKCFHEAIVCLSFVSLSVGSASSISCSYLSLLNLCLYLLYLLFPNS